MHRDGYKIQIGIQIDKQVEQSINQQIDKSIDQWIDRQIDREECGQSTLKYNLDRRSSQICRQRIKQNSKQDVLSHQFTYERQNISRRIEKNKKTGMSCYVHLIFVERKHGLYFTKIQMLCDAVLISAVHQVTQFYKTIKIENLKA